MMVLVVFFFRIFEITFFCFVVSIFDLVHDAKTLFHFPQLLTENCSFRTSLIFQKRFPDVVRSEHMPCIASTSCTRSSIATTKQSNSISKT